ncbi:hypothetical protein UXN83_02005 [Enterobacter roggenkampii]|uniref:hypothetical protein n=1 Tax=Enterobacter roggenkampii TaxID=1812935 RepID=UPI002FD2D600
MEANPPKVIFSNLELMNCDVISCLSFCKFISLLALEWAGNCAALTAFHYRAIRQGSGRNSWQHRGYRAFDSDSDNSSRKRNLCR